MEELIQMQELVLLNQESRQWIRETEDAIAAGDRELALSDAEEIVAANRKGRVYLWPANDEGAPPVSQHRPVSDELDEQYRMEPFDDRLVPTGAEWDAESWFRTFRGPKLGHLLLLARGYPE